MGSPIAESWWILALSFAAKCGVSQSSLSLLASLLLLFHVWLAADLLYWSSPGGRAWGRYWWSKGGRHAVIPGPRGLPFLGSMGLMSTLAHRRLASAAEVFDARRLMAFSLGETRAVVTGDPDVAKEILSSAAFADRPLKESAYGLMFHQAIGFAPYGVYWRTLRRIAATHLFCPKQVALAAPKRAHIAAQMVGSLASAVEGEAVRVRDVLKQASLNNIMWSVFGREYDITTSPGIGSHDHQESRELRQLVEEGYDLLGKVNFSDHLPFLGVLDLQGIRHRCSKLVPQVNRFVGRIILEHRARPAAAVAGPTSGIPDFVDVLLTLQGGTDGLSDSEMVAVLWEMIFRGTDTVAVLVEWVLARLVLHGDVQQKVHAELDRVVGRHRPVAESDPASLPYLGAVIKEVLRLHPPGPLLSWARLATSDTVVDGRVVPAGTTAMVNLWAITHDPRVWPEPTRFSPDRFLGGTCVDFSTLFGSDLRLAPFGSGRRSCPGKALAVATVGFWVASLLHEFEWLPQTPGEGRVDLSEVLRLSCEMASPLTVRLRRRRGHPSPSLSNCI
uniref:Cytochrome P450 78A3 n=2 Tax=Anthurium amnicola TaxID=1678845 RepID=A0A1D1XP14_9ARAE